MKRQTKKGVANACGLAAKARKLARYLDSTCLKPTATEAEIDALCQVAREYSFASVCVHPSEVARCAENLRGSDVKVCTVVGFPLGKNDPYIKGEEALRALEDGADELDVVLNVSLLKAACATAAFDAAAYGKVLFDLTPFHDRVAEERARTGREIATKLIIECCNLTDLEKRIACHLAKELGFDFVKTSTGFGSGGATVDDVRLMRETVGPEMGVKAAGGIRGYEEACRMIAAGATRIGTSSAEKIMEEGARDGYASV